MFQSQNSQNQGFLEQWTKHLKFLRLPILETRNGQEPKHRIALSGKSAARQTDPYIVTLISAPMWEVVMK